MIDESTVRKEAVARMGIEVEFLRPWEDKDRPFDVGEYGLILKRGIRRLFVKTESTMTITCIEPLDKVDPASHASVPTGRGEIAPRPVFVKLQHEIVRADYLGTEIPGYPDAPLTMETLKELLDWLAGQDPTRCLEVSCDRPEGHKGPHVHWDSGTWTTWEAGSQPAEGER